MDQDTDYEQLSDNELVDKMRDAAVMERFEKSTDWKIVREACKRAKAKALSALVKENPDNKTTIIELQKIAQIYGDFLPSLVNSFRQESALVKIEAKLRGWHKEILEKIYSE